MSLPYEKIFDTKNATREDWLLARRQGIGGSDMAAILGYSTFKCALDIWKDKTSSEPPEDRGNRFTKWGTRLEPLVADAFEEETGLKVRRNNFILRSKEHPYLLANLDREIIGTGEGLECKTTNAYKTSDWDADKVPDAYYIQCQHYMAVTGADVWWIACLIGGNDFKYKKIPRDERVISFIIEQGKRFWDLVESKQMPEVDGSKATNEALKSLYPQASVDAKELEPYAMSYIEEYKKACEEEKRIKERKLDAQNHLCAMLGDFQKGTCGLFSVNWTNVKGRESFDKAKFMKEHPGVYEQYVKIGKPTRRFSLDEVDVDGGK